MHRFAKRQVDENQKKNKLIGKYAFSLLFIIHLAAFLKKRPTFFIKLPANDCNTLSLFIQIYNEKRFYFFVISTRHSADLFLAWIIIVGKINLAGLIINRVINGGSFR